MVEWASEEEEERESVCVRVCELNGRKVFANVCGNDSFFTQRACGRMISVYQLFHLHRRRRPLRRLQRALQQ